MKNDAAEYYHKYLDATMTAIFSSGLNRINSSDLEQKVHLVLNNITDSSEDDIVIVNDPAKTINSAFYYLIEEGYISDLPPFIKLKYRGIIKLSEGGFTADYRRSIKKMRREDTLFYRTMDNYSTTNVYQIVTIICAVLGFLISLVSLGASLG